MSDSSRRRADEFLKIADQFKLGVLVTESSHPVTADLSEVAKRDIAEALDLLFQVDEDVVRKYREFVESGRFEPIADVVTEALRAGGRILFTGCGATGRLSILLDSIWRRFWRECRPKFRGDWESRTISIMAGGDFALIKSVEGFEDITAFGRRQIAEQGVCERDVVFAITEGGETSWVIGTAWEALERGAKVYFVYNNPDDILCEHVQRSREIIEEPRIEKVNLTTGPMAITGSTRMQATTIELCVMVTILEMVIGGILNRESAKGRKREMIPELLAGSLQELLATLRSEEVREQLARLVEMEESVYRQGGKTNYFANALALDVLTDTTERSPTFCTPSFRRYDDLAASESWVYLFTRPENTEEAWKTMLTREPRAVEWTRKQVGGLVPDDDVDKRYEVIKRISLHDIYKFRIGLEGVGYRQLGAGDAAVEIVTDGDRGLLDQLHSAQAAGARTGLVCLARPFMVQKLSERIATWPTKPVSVLAPLPQGESFLKGITHVAVKMLLNALSTCTMVRLGRVMGNYMIYVVPSNLKLIDRATRYISKLSGLAYEDACRLLFEVIEYVEPRMTSDQAYPPVVGVSVLRAREGLTNEEAEEKLAQM